MPILREQAIRTSASTTPSSRGPDVIALLQGPIGLFLEQRFTSARNGPLNAIESKFLPFSRNIIENTVHGRPTRGLSNRFKRSVRPDSGRRVTRSRRCYGDVSVPGVGISDAFDLSGPASDSASITTSF